MLAVAPLSRLKSAEGVVSVAERTSFGACDGAGAFDAVAYINAPSWQASRLGLHRMEELLERLGRPQDSLRFVHVAGTNGKGSTCAYIASVLQAAGLSTGLFTSPFIETFEERIRVDGAVISAAELKRATLRVRDAAEAMAAEPEGEHPTEFELMFAVALVHFRAAGCAVAVVEVGLGGRLDATNVIEAPVVCAITRIGYDHTALLGDSIAAIAGEKAGIIKPGAAVVTCEQVPEAASVIARVCEERGCSLRVVRSDEVTVGAIDWEAVPPRRSFAFDGICHETALLASYQPENAAVALGVCAALRRAGWPVDRRSEQEGIASARWPARFEVLGVSPLLIVDGAHNLDGARALVASLAEVQAGRAQSGGGVIMVMSVLADKDYEAMVATLAARAQAFFTFTAPSPRALSAEELAVCARTVAPSVEAHSCSSASAALEGALARADVDDIVVACGSLYSVADVKKAAQKLGGIG